MSSTSLAAGAKLDVNNRCTFSVWAPLKEDVRLVLPGRKPEEYPMTKDLHGMWGASVDNVTPLTRYFFRIGDKLLPDPASRFQPEGVHGPSAVIDQGFSWTDNEWSGIPLRDMVIYELHTGTFTSEGTFAGILGKLPYLRELGVNAIEIMPIAQFPGSRNWGYDGVYPFAVQNSYGGPDGLKRLVDAAHSHGIAVILDVVYNHQGPEGNYLSEFGPYFSDRYKTFWGSAINFDDAWCDGVRNFYWQNALMWLDEFHIDGLRLDAVHAIWDFSARHFIEELMTKVKALETRTGRTKVLIAEFDLNNPRYINDASVGGYGMDGQWIDEFHHALHSLLTGETDGYYEDFGTVSHLAKAIRDSYVYTGQYSLHRKKYFGRAPSLNHYGQFVIFAQNHDQVGNRMLGDRLTTQLSLESLKLAAAAILLAPQVPMLFMGEEYGEKNPFQYFISHTDEKLVDMVREGRRKEFSYFNWEGEVPDPQSEKTFQQCMLSWSTDDDRNQILLNYYKHLIAFRRTRKAMRGIEKESVLVFEPKSEVISFKRTHEADQLYILLNFAKQSVTLTADQSIPKSRKVFDSTAEEWGGPGQITASTIVAGEEFVLPPQSAIIFEL